MKSIKKGCEYTKTIFEKAYNESPSGIEFLLKNFGDIAKRSVEYGPETMRPFVDSFFHFMEFDIGNESKYLDRILESVRPVVQKTMYLKQMEALQHYLRRLSDLGKPIREKQNYRSAEIYIIALREIFQELLRYEIKDRREFSEDIFFAVRDIFSGFSKFDESEIKRNGGRRLETLTRIVNESCNIGYTLINKKEIDLFDGYLDMLEYMYLVVDELGWDYYPTREPYEIDSYEKSKEIREKLENEFFLLLFRLGVFSISENRLEFISRLLSRDEIGRSFSLINYRLHEDFLGDFRPESYIGWALRASVQVLGGIGRFAPMREAIQFYLLIRSKAFFRQMRKNINDTWDFSGRRLIELLEADSGWIFFGGEKPKDCRLAGKGVSLLPDFIRKIENFNKRQIEAKGCPDFPDYMRTVKVFEDKKTLFENVLSSFANNDIISQESFAGALEEFLKITIHFLDITNEVWKKERERIERSFPIMEEKRENAKKMIRKALEEEGIFRMAAGWRESDQEMLQKTEFKLNEVIWKKRIESRLLKDLPIIASFDTLGGMAAKREDEEILDMISGRNIKKMRMPLKLNLKTIGHFIDELDCERLILITGQNIQKDFWDSGERKYLRRVDRMYEVPINENRKAFLYNSDLFKGKTLLFAEDQFFEILYSEKVNINIRFPEENELDDEEIKEDFQAIVISQRRSLRFSDLTKAILIEHSQIDQ